jgi:hypothetical protein
MAETLKAPAPYSGKRIPMERLDQTQAAPFYSNLVTNTCTACNYDTNNGYFVLGPTNCFAAGSTQWIAYPFVAAKTGAVRKVLLSVTDSGFCVATSLKFTVAIFDDACLGVPNAQLAAKTATAPAAPCALATANFGATGPTLTAGNTYWVVAMTAGATQDGFTGIWWEANSAVFGVNFNDGNGWLTNPAASPGGFSVQ